MSAARDQFLSIRRFAIGDAAAARASFEKAAALWRALGNSFSAGVSMMCAAEAARSSPSAETMSIELALDDFRKVIDSEKPRSLLRIAALHKMSWSLRLAAFTGDFDQKLVRARTAELRAELASAMELRGAKSQHASSFFVSGIIMTTDLDGSWKIQYPDHEVADDTESLSTSLTINVPSAFSLHVRNRDWASASSVVASHNAGFVSPGLRGWRAVALANVQHASATKHFDLAATEFETDIQPKTHDELAARGKQWSAINVELWARYFRSRARLIEALQTPKEIVHLISMAAEAWGSGEIMFNSPDALRLKSLVKSIASLFAAPATFDRNRAVEDYKAAIRYTGENEEDAHALEFLANVAEGLESIATEPFIGLTRGKMDRAIHSLSRIPVIGQSGADAMREPLGKCAYEILLGPVRTWMHRELGKIKDETRLHTILLRLLQAGLPKYAQVRHGPIEYGKDVVALLERDGERVARYYQVKCGDINKTNWRECREELEEIFQVPFSSLQIGDQPARIEAFLLTNGHANAHVEPVIDGWIREQRTRGRSIQFVHLDSWIDWIVTRNLSNELREALSDRKVLKRSTRRAKKKNPTK